MGTYVKQNLRNSMTKISRLLNGDTLKMISKPDKPLDSSSPMAGIYLTSNKQMVMVSYNNKDLIATKLTGSLHVPSGKETFIIDLRTHSVKVRHAQRMFQYPSWSYDYSMVKVEREYMEMKEKDDYWYSSYNSNSEVTKYFHLSTFKAILVT